MDRRNQSMKTAVLPKAALLLLIFTILCGMLYTGVITAASQLFFPKQANGSLLEGGGQIRGSELLGQRFTDDNHMWGRMADLDLSTFRDENGKPLMYAAPSNLSPAGDVYQDLIAERVSKLRAAHPDQGKAAIPADLVTGSGSGLDPHISPAAAEYQVSRLAEANGMSEGKVRDIIEANTNNKFLGVFGEETVNVLKVNLALEGIEAE